MPCKEGNYILGTTRPFHTFPRLLSWETSLPTYSNHPKVRRRVPHSVQGARAVGSSAWSIGILRAHGHGEQLREGVKAPCCENPALSRQR